MWYNVLFDMIMFAAIAVLAIASQIKFGYIIAGLAIAGIFTRLIFLRELIIEIRESAPVKRPKKNKTNMKRMIVTIIALELVAAVSLYILYSNGIAHSFLLDAISCAMALLLGILIS